MVGKISKTGGNTVGAVMNTTFCPTAILGVGLTTVVIPWDLVVSQDWDYIILLLPRYCHMRVAST